MRIIVIVIALVAIAGGAWYYLGMPGYAPGADTATAPAVTPDTPAADAATPASPGAP